MAADVVKFADLISALLGLAGALVLAIPAIRAVRPKRHWERVTQLQAQHQGDPETAKALEGIKGHVEAEQLGDSRGTLVVNALGFVLLVLSFGFLLIAALARAAGG